MKNNQDLKVSEFVITDKKSEDLSVAKEFIENLLTLRKLEKNHKTYIRGTRRALENTKNGKVYSNYRLTGTVTGRISCGKYTAPEDMGISFHVLPRSKEVNIRSMFVAPPGHKFITVDYSGMELRVLAHICQDENMLQAFNSGDGDLHSYTASLILNKEKISKEERQLAKAVSFCIVYGGGAQKIAQEAGVTVHRAQRVLKKYERIYPGIFRWMQETRSFIAANHYSVSLFGRRRNLPNVTSPNSNIREECFRQGVNFVIQSSASDILLCAIADINRELKSRKMSDSISATVHDSIEFIAPDEEVPELLEIIQDKMLNYPLMKERFGIDLAVPLNIEVEIGDSFGTGELIELNG